MLFDIALPTPLTQSVLPVLVETGTVVGFLPITETVFTESPTSIATVDGVVVARSVSFPSPGDDGSGKRPSLYMALVYPIESVPLRPWLGFTGLVQPSDCGYFSRWTASASGILNRFGNGMYIDALVTGLASPQGATDPSAPPTPESVEWSATVNIQAMGSLSFFDFNWLKLYTDNPATAGAGLSPVSITVLENPASGNFKASLVGKPIALLGLGRPMLFDTVRVIRLSVPPAGVYVFRFLVTTADGNTIVCSFSLKVTP